jgi:hypothetical protein
MNKNSLNKEVKLEYNFRIDDRGLTYLVTYYTKYCATKASHVFMFGFLRTSTSAARIYRLTSKLMEKALPDTKDVKLWAQGIPNSWFNDPPRLPKEITKTRARKPEDLANNENLTNNSGLGGLTDAPPSAETREHVYEPIQRENQTEGKSV